ncbi:unnamed protein product [Caenorhabditis bovis]|uniref:Uncharacterized protein n=1 Tax=Caenorhabditis bovis TaxID=2654633 RepID=A0A8S1F5S0_9PELO|nr:unnamed protein product [Caenorhabditis bovis]
MESVTDELLQEWAASSQLLYYTVVVVSILTLPALIFVFFLLRKSTRTVYLVFLEAIVCGNFMLLATIFSNVISDQKFRFLADLIPGVVICKLSAFLVNSSSFFVHWSWRYLHVYYPFKAHRSQERSKHIIFGICACSVISQLWSPILITEIKLSSNSASGSYCAEDPNIFGHMVLKYLILSECLLAFFVPFLLTVLADCSVLIFKNPRNRQNFTSFAVVGVDQLFTGASDLMPLKIVHRSKIVDQQRKRTKAIRRCLVLATTTLLYRAQYLPLLDEFYNFRESLDPSIQRNFIRADALVYVIYLLQFPTVPLYMYCLNTDFDRRKSYVQSYF